MAQAWSHGSLRRLRHSWGTSINVQKEVGPLQRRGTGEEASLSDGALTDKPEPSGWRYLDQPKATGGRAVKENY